MIQILLKEATKALLKEAGKAFLIAGVTAIATELGTVVVQRVMDRETK